jgi:hypothetical protein
VPVDSTRVVSLWSQPQWMGWVHSRMRQDTRDTGWRLHGLFTALHQYVRESTVPSRHTSCSGTANPSSSFRRTLVQKLVADPASVARSPTPSNILVRRRVASTTTTPHFHSQSSTCPQRVDVDHTLTMCHLDSESYTCRQTPFHNYCAHGLADLCVV